jgi:hypothetical protein
MVDSSSLILPFILRISPYRFYTGFYNSTLTTTPGHRPDHRSSQARTQFRNYYNCLPTAIVSPLHIQHPSQCILHASPQPPMNCQVFPAFPLNLLLSFPLDICRTSPFVLFGDYGGSLFRFLTQVSFSTRFPTLRISAGKCLCPAHF